MYDTYLMAYDETGNITGFYPKSLSCIYKTIPEVVVEITYEEWQFLLTNPLFQYAKINDKFICKDTTGATQERLALWEAVTQRFLG